MPAPRSVVKINKNGVTFTSNVERVQYTITELTRCALRDVGRYVAYLCNGQTQERLKRHGMRRGMPKGKALAFQYWVRKKETDLQVGIRPGTWYGTLQELGDKHQPRKQILRDAVYNNLSTIRDIEGKYLSAIEQEQQALALIESEGDYQGGGDE